jgi:protein SCO1/2
MSARALRIAALAIVAFAGGLFLARALLQPAAPPTTERATVLDEPRTLPKFALLDQDGRAFTRADLEGHWTLVFFGFTRCPDVCPTTLATLSRALQQLDDLDAAQRPRVLLISVDPERDTPELLAAYVRFFNPDFHGATGRLPAVSELAAAFGVPFARVATASGDYSVDHGAGIFVVDPRARIRAYSSAPHDAAVIARDLRRVVGAGSG